MDVILWAAGLILFVLACAYILAYVTKPERDPNVLSPDQLKRYDLPDELATRRPPLYDRPPISISSRGVSSVKADDILNSRVGREEWVKAAKRKPFKGPGAA